ncbi:GAF domain-containing protein [Pseudonocardia endophytica]|uniref:GAF domain-containing protein n=1 Tax=Pseudonocardia endophytica TaxID=401976 RepID=A0A4R1I493_PSEEN|nr:GAF domain-containing protein [Pseudonocardia endophytica]TCK24842.1 GAF domain-containing protein [Pseudonocardia endophytica]
MAAPLPSSRPDASTAVMRIALQVGATPVAHVDIGTMLTGVCSALPPAVGVAAAVLVLTDPADPRDPEGQQVFASDDAANRLGLIQQRAGRGPVPAAVRGDRPLAVPDLTVSGPPELAAAAADCGLVRSLVVPLSESGQPAGGLQLLAGSDASLDERSASMLSPLMGALSARLADARELARVSARVTPDVEQDEDPEFPPETTAVPTLVEQGPEPDPESADPDTNDAEDGDGYAAESDDVAHEETLPLVPVTPHPVVFGETPPVTERDPVTDLFAAGETVEETPPTGQARLGWEGPEHTPPPTAVPPRALPARVPSLGRVARPTPHPVPRPVPRPVPAAVPEQRSEAVPMADPTAAPEPAGPAPVAAGPVPAPEDATNGTDDPTWRVPRHRLRDEI